MTDLIAFLILIAIFAGVGALYLLAGRQQARDDREDNQAFWEWCGDNPEATLKEMDEAHDCLVVKKGEPK